MMTYYVLNVLSGGLDVMAYGPSAPYAMTSSQIFYRPARTNSHFYAKLDWEFTKSSSQ